MPSSYETYHKVRYQPTSRELGLPPDREFVLGGFFLAWLAMNDLLSKSFVELVGEETVAELKARRLTGPELYANLDGVLDSDMVSEAARGFCAYYLTVAGSSWAYLQDFQRTFGVSARTAAELYGVEDTWANFDRIAPVIGRAFQAWTQG